MSPTRQSIAAARVQIGADPGRLDVLVNNAGIGLDFGVSGLEPDFEVMEQTLQTNFFGAYRTAAGDAGPAPRKPSTRGSSTSRAAWEGVSEMGGWSPGYRVSKASMNAMTRILSAELAAEGVLVNSACPGFVASDMGSPMGATKSLEDGAVGDRLAGDPAGRRPHGRVLPRRPADRLLRARSGGRWDHREELPCGVHSASPSLLEHKERRGVEQSGSSSGS